MPYGIPGDPIEASRPQRTAALVVSGTGDSLVAAPDWSAATILTADAAALDGDCIIDVADCPDGASRWLWLTPTDTKTVTLSATGGTLKRLNGLDTNPFTGTATTTTVVMIARKGTVYGVTIAEESDFS
jgi:hypothetical protein